MADASREIRTLRLHELISAPLVAMVEAEALAAKATLEYVETVGFAAEADSQSGSPGAEGSGEVADAGQLRMVEFRYKKLDENDDVAEFVSSVPILSLVPIPAIQITEGKVSFSAKIVEITKQEENGAEAAPAVAEARPTSRLVTWLRPKGREVLTRPVPSSGPKEKEVRGTYHLEIEVSVGQADVPLGFERVFNLMDQAIQDRKASGT